MAGVSGCMKYSMFFFNFLFWTVQANIPAIYLMIAIGAIIMGLGFFGCCGAIRESRCLLLLFFIGLLLIFTLLVTAGILGVVYRSKAEGMLTDTLQEYIPIELQPAVFKTDIEKLQTQPCLQYLTDMMTEHAGIILGVAFGLAVVMLFGLGFSMSLYCQIGRK
ncbi:Tetraspanin-8 [Acipenser ruthenus]|uniref:Tetraspanin-8 n=1 Tax=Acipenser ruthenus TaxID=7906 RepID=A0A662YN04_ACIRT|nr:Tetraspanin-8 [Acipenser ruthenus]